jgi:hypothetical protein
MSLLSLPPENPRIRQVGSFGELVSTSFENGINALCWARNLPGDFGEIVEKLNTAEDLTVLEESDLLSQEVSEAGKVAIAQILSDMHLLHELDREPVLNIISAYPRDDTSSPVPTDVYSFHVDSAPFEADTWLCTYHGAPSEGLRNEDAIRRIDLPGNREALLEEFGGEDDDSFLEYLADGCFDLHYVPVPGAKPFPFSVGNLWRIAVEYPGCPVPACIHRAPENHPGQAARLLLIC